MNRFAIARVGDDLGKALRKVAEGIGLAERVGQSVFVKPNFTYPFYKEGVTTSRAVLWSLTELLREYGCTRICIGEGEGGYNAFSMDQTFENFGMSEFKEEFGVEVVNLSRWPSCDLVVSVDGHEVRVPVPRPLFEEFDSFVSVPVPKVHCMTTISNGLKNQWGVVQDVMRIKLHYALAEILTELNLKLPNVTVIGDGRFGLTRNGPMIDGVPVPLGWVSGCDNVFLNDLLTCSIMGISPQRVNHLKYAAGRGLIPTADQYALPADFLEFRSSEFYLEPNVWNRLAKLTWYSQRLNHLVYFSKASGALHQVMYRIRHHPKELDLKGVDWT